MREDRSHKWLIRSGALQELLLTGLLRASRDEHLTLHCACQALVKFCIRQEEMLRRRPFTSPRVIWAATSMLRDGDFSPKRSTPTLLTLGKRVNTV